MHFSLARINCFIIANQSITFVCHTVERCEYPNKPATLSLSLSVSLSLITNIIITRRVSMTSSLRIDRITFVSYCIPLYTCMTLIQ